MQFSIELGFTDMKYEKFDDIDDIDEDNLFDYCEDIDDYKFYNTTLILNINGEEHTLTAEEYDEKIYDILNPSKGKIIVIKDEREYCFDNYPNDYGDVDGWICESLKNDIENNSVDVKNFKYLGNGIEPIKGSGSCWSYKGEGIEAYISCDMGSEESVNVFIDGEKVMSA